MFFCFTLICRLLTFTLVFSFIPHILKPFIAGHGSPLKRRFKVRHAGPMRIGDLISLGCESSSACRFHNQRKKLLFSIFWISWYISTTMIFNIYFIWNTPLVFTQKNLQQSDLSDFCLTVPNRSAKWATDEITRPCESVLLMIFVLRLHGFCGAVDVWSLINRQLILNERYFRVCNRFHGTVGFIILRSNSASSDAHSMQHSTRF